MESLIFHTAQWREHMALLLHLVAAYVALRCLWASRRAEGRTRHRLWACGAGAGVMAPVAAAPMLGILPAGLVAAMALLAAGSTGRWAPARAMATSIGVGLMGLVLASVGTGKIPSLGMGPSMWPTTDKHLSLMLMEHSQGTVDRGDRVDFHVPLAQASPDPETGWPGGRYHKRVMGVAGDHVVIEAYGIVVNGVRVADCQPGAGTVRLTATTWLCDGKIPRADGTFVRYQMTWGEPDIWMNGAQQWRLEPGQVLVLGDNLIVSADSRLRGPIPAEWVVGTVVE